MFFFLSSSLAPGTPLLLNSWKACAEETRVFIQQKDLKFVPTWDISYNADTWICLWIETRNCFLGQFDPPLLGLVSDRVWGFLRAQGLSPVVLPEYDLQALNGLFVLFHIKLSMALGGDSRSLVAIHSLVVFPGPWTANWGPDYWRLVVRIGQFPGKFW